MKLCVGDEGDVQHSGDSSACVRAPLLVYVAICRCTCALGTRTAMTQRRFYRPACAPKA